MERSAVMDACVPGAAEEGCPEDTAPLPARRADLVVRPSDEKGGHVVKDPVTGEYFELGPQESFLLKGLDGRTTGAELRAAFGRRFDEDLSGFLCLARGQGFLREKDVVGRGSPGTPAEAGEPAGHPGGSSGEGHLEGAPARHRGRQSILAWRARVFDPDRLFNVLEPRLRFVWTRGFFWLSAVAVVAAVPLVWTNRFELVTRFATSLTWEMVLIAWLTLVTVTTCHEFAHGLTCKHWGGEVHKVGFLLLYFTPCFYCNVSDAWLFREKSKRLWVTFAGAWCDLMMWAAAVFVWRLTMQDTVANYLAWIVLSVCGARVFFNFNPLLKLDGYYLLSDLTGLRNLRQRSWDAVAARVRWALWGAPRPAPELWGRFLLGFGAAAWVYSLVLLGLMFWALVGFAGGRWGVAGQVAAAGMGVVVIKGLFCGFCGGEVTNMIQHRRGRVMVWVAVTLAVVAALAVLPYEDRATGAMDLRPAERADVRAPVAGFLREVRVGEGDGVGRRDVVAVMEVPDLNNRIAARLAELAEARGRIQLVDAGPRATSDEAHRELEIRAAEAEIARATVERLRGELLYLETLARRQTVRAPVGGVVATAHLSERVGEFMKEGDLICAVEGAGPFVAEVAVPEQQVARVRPGQAVKVKVRALPFETFNGRVERVAPVAAREEGQVQGTVKVYCRLEGGTAVLRPGMTGDARVSCGRRPVGVVALDRAMRVIRTEFWW